MNILQSISAVIAPPVCELCGRRLVGGEQGICTVCLTALPLCHEDPGEMRLARLPRTAPVQRVFVWLEYRHDNPAAMLIRSGKYSGRPHIFNYLGIQLARKAHDALGPVDCIIPVPMHWLKRLRRGYNQSWLLAAAIARQYDIPVVNALKAVRYHCAQAARNNEQRRANLAGAFRHTRMLKGMHVALVDDVITTGATLSQAIIALSAAAPASITVICLAAAH